MPKFAHRGGLEVTANEFYSRNFRNIVKSCLKIENRCGFCHALFSTTFFMQLGGEGLHIFNVSFADGAYPPSTVGFQPLLPILQLFD